MIVARVYGVLDRLVCEVTCVHLGDQDQSHMVIREERSVPDGDVRSALRCLAEVADLAVFHVDAERTRLGGTSPADCRP